MWKFYGKVQFSHSFGRFARNYAETVPFHKISTQGNLVKLRYFTQCFLQFNFFPSNATSERFVAKFRSKTDLKSKMKSATHNNRLNLISFSYQQNKIQNISKLVFSRYPTSLLLEKTREKNKLVYYKFHNIRIDTVFKSG